MCIRDSDYAAQGQLDEAAEILHQGYETTQSEILLQNYCATVLNSVVAVSYTHLRALCNCLHRIVTRKGGRAV